MSSQPPVEFGSPDGTTPPPLVPIVTAKRDYGRSPKGGSGAHFIACDDEQEYVVKFRRDQGPRLLPNEFLGAALGRLMGCPIADAALVTFTKEFIEASPEIARSGVPPGLYFGCRKLRDAMGFSQFANATLTLDSLTIENRSRFPHVVVFDNWTMNSDRHGADNNLLVLVDKDRKVWRYYMIDQGHLFKDPQWTPDRLAASKDERVLQNCHDFLVRSISGATPFAEALKSLEGVGKPEIVRAVEEIPGNWDVDGPARKALVEVLSHRQPVVRSVIDSSRARFAGWR